MLPPNVRAAQFPVAASLRKGHRNDEIHACSVQRLRVPLVGADLTNEACNSEFQVAVEQPVNRPYTLLASVGQVLNQRPPAWVLPMQISITLRVDDRLNDRPEQLGSLGLRLLAPELFRTI